ncbi:hypothetical protein L0663_05140 [Dyadobacter sp. CY107]|uniref:hypothetical protein n=1 Tax=Dyadobacter fanqingshengii TaxID=2906443 RepID=UPI001F2BAD36|nr:hypothetical protein [Dyadobacter fanqingshengii]MCF2502752.1 hypothetical protein [Dyadobacter fanqingshengii]
MKETLESIRNFHNVLVVVCAAGFLFSLSARPTINPYHFTKTVLLRFAQDVPLLNDSEFLNEDKSPILTGLQMAEIFHKTEVRHIYSLVKERRVIAKDASVEKDSLMQAAVIKFLIDHVRGITYPNYIVRSSSFDSLLLPHEENFITIAEDSDFSKARGFVKNGTLNEAIAKLGPESDIYEKQPDTIANLSGFSVSGRHMPFIAPIIGFLLFLYLYALIAHASSLVEKDKTPLSWFPWIGLLSDNASRFLTPVTLIGFPAISAINSIFTLEISAYWRGGISLAYFAILFFVWIFMERKIGVLKANRE